MNIRKIPALTSTVQNYIKKVQNKLYANRFCLTEKPDTFCKQEYIHNFTSCDFSIGNRRLANNLLENLTPERYKKYTASDIDLIRSQIPKNTAVSAEIVVNMSKMLKNIFDNKYGKGNYVFISIGRSLSTVSQCMEYMGIETRRIPFSGCGGNYYKGISEDIVKQLQFVKYKTFLKTKLQNTQDKKCIYCDFAATGSTLATFKELLNNPKVKLGSKNDTFIDITVIIHKIGTKYPRMQKELIFFLNKLARQSFDTYADIGYLNYKSLRLIPNVQKPESTRDMRDFQFCLLDILNQTKS